MNAANAMETSLAEPVCILELDDPNEGITICDTKGSVFWIRKIENTFRALLPSEARTGTFKDFNRRMNRSRSPMTIGSCFNRFADPRPKSSTKKPTPSKKMSEGHSELLFPPDPVTHSTFTIAEHLGTEMIQDPTTNIGVRRGFYVLNNSGVVSYLQFSVGTKPSHYHSKPEQVKVSLVTSVAAKVEVGSISNLKRDLDYVYARSQRSNNEVLVFKGPNLLCGLKVDIHPDERIEDLTVDSKKNVMHVLLSSGSIASVSVIGIKHPSTQNPKNASTEFLDSTFEKPGVPLQITVCKCNKQSYKNKGASFSERI